MPLPALAVGAAKALPYVASGLGAIFGRPKKAKNNTGKVVAKYLAMRANGYVTDADRAAAERVTTRGARTAGAQRANDERMTLNRMARTNQIGSGAQDRAFQQIADRQSAALEDAAMAGADAEYGAYNRNKGFEENKIYQGMAAETRAAESQYASDQMRTSSYYNSLLDTIGQIGALMPGAKPQPSPAAQTTPQQPAAPVRPAPTAPTLAYPRLQSQQPRLNAAPARPRLGGAGRRIAGGLMRSRTGTSQFAYSG